MSKKPIGIIAAMPQEVKTLTACVDNPQTAAVAGMDLVSGTINAVPVVIMRCGIGKVNAAIGTTLMIEHYQPSAIINTGSAGGINNRLDIGDVVIASNVTHHDVDISIFGYAAGQMAQMPENYPCDAGLVDLTQQAASAFTNAVVHHGQIVSGDQFIADSTRFAAIKTTFPEALAVEMEAAAIAQTCYRFAVPFVVIRAISDLADEQASVSFAEFIEQAAQYSADMVIRLINLIREQ